MLEAKREAATMYQGVDRPARKYSSSSLTWAGGGWEAERPTETVGAVLVDRRRWLLI